MKRAEATDRAVSIWMTGEAPAGPENMTALVRRTLRQAGLQPWPCVEAELFQAGDDTLVIARPGKRPAFYFPGLEELVSGTRACPEEPSALYLCPDGYLLTLPQSAVRPGLYEYGEPRSLASGWEAHATDQGLLLLGVDALRALHSYFTT